MQTIRHTRQLERRASGRARCLWALTLLLGLVPVAYGSLAAIARAGDTHGPEPAPDRAASGEKNEPVRLERRSDPDHVPTAIDVLVDKFEPAHDAWDVEVLNEAVHDPLATLVEWIEHPQAIDPERVSNLVVPDFESSLLRPVHLNEVLDDGMISVRRAAPGTLGSPGTVSPGARRGAARLREAIEQMTAGLGADGETYAEFHVSGIERSEAFFTTRLLFSASRRSQEGGVRQNATWLCRWSYPATDPPAAPRLASIEVEGYEETAIDGAPAALFEDVTASALGGDPSYRAQVLPGVGHWLTRISRASGMSFAGHHGLAVGDVDGDGLEDLYVCDAGGLPNRLYRQNPDGTLSDISARAGVDWLAETASALFVDLDNDGDQDLVVATRISVLVAENDGDGRFGLRGAHSVTSDAASLAAADYDNDGDLDLYVCSYYADANEEQLPGPVPYHDANNGGANALLRNDGSFRFVDATQASGLDANNTRYSFAAAWEDYDDDGDADLYVANDFGRNNLYRNDGGRFTDVARDADVEDVAAGMSVSWGDYDRDGRMDVYVGNMYSNAGHRVSYQRQFSEEASERTVADLQRMARGNTLFANQGDGTFRDVSESAGVTMGRWAWSSKFLDMNNDGWLDIVVANGYVTAEDTGDL